MILFIINRCCLIVSLLVSIPKAPGFSERLKLKDDVVSTILDPMWHHTSVSNCFYYVITIALSL